MNGETAVRVAVPDSVKSALDEFQRNFHVDVHLWTAHNDRGSRVHLYPEGGAPEGGAGVGVITCAVTPQGGPPLELEVHGRSDGTGSDTAEAVAAVLRSVLKHAYDFAQEVRFFTYELSERYEEINLLYSISETLGSILRLDDATRVILGEVCDVLGALRGSLWVYEPEGDSLNLTAAVGEDGPVGPIDARNPDAVTAQVFRRGRPMIVSREAAADAGPPLPDPAEPGTFLSVPIRYTPPAGESRTVGVINLVGRRHGGRFTASDQKLLSAIASQVGAAVENNRLIRESLRQERVAQEMQLAHDLQMKLLPVAEKFDGARVAARVEPAASVGGDFYHLLKLPAGRVGFAAPASVLRHLDDALRDELESTEMYLSIFYAVLDPASRRIVFANAGHPHAFIVHGDGSTTRLAATDPPVGIALEGSYGQTEMPWDPTSELLFCFTDGLSDSLTTHACGGEDRVLGQVVASRERSPIEIVEALFGLVVDARAEVPSDDRTALVLRG